ncbi:DsbA family protein [Methanobrevibacter sp.]|uniref:DsbA family oxidoreductase n=1 Tax=Methanobrevibacter sp. TaxID=66852 RepID=UPI00388D9CD0
MKIIYWSDFNCPYCYIGNTRLKKAINELNLDIKMEMKAFEVEPEESDEIATPMKNHYARKYGIPEFVAIDELKEIDEIGRQEGLNYDYSNSKITSSRNAHRLVKLASSKMDDELVENICEKLSRAFLCERKTLSDKEVLIEIGTSEGLNEKEIEEMLESDKYQVEVQIDEEDARLNSVNSVPFYFIEKGDETLAIPGALTTEEFKNALKDLISGDIEDKLE